MLKNFGLKSAFLMLTAAATALSFAPVAEATPVNYDFTVHVTQSNSPVLKGSTAIGSFSYDSSSIVAGGDNKALDLLTALDFTFNNITYDASMANTGRLTFDANGNLTDFLFGSHCSAGSCKLIRGNSFFVNSADFKFFARVPANAAGSGATSFSLAPVAVPEPGTLGLFGLGALLLSLLVGTRRRVS